MNNKLIILIGCARSGKSTLSKMFVSNDNKDREAFDNKFDIDLDKNCPRVVVNADALRLAWSGFRYNSHCEDMIHATNKMIVKKYLILGYHVLVDETNTLEHSIKSWFKIRNDAIPILIDTPPEVCIERAHKTGQGDLEKSIWRMYNNLGSLWNKYYSMDVPMDLSRKNVWQNIFNEIRMNTPEVKGHIV